MALHETKQCQIGTSIQGLGEIFSHGIIILFIVCFILKLFSSVLLKSGSGYDNSPKKCC